MEEVGSSSLSSAQTRTTMCSLPGPPLCLSDRVALRKAQTHDLRWYWDNVSIRSGASVSDGCEAVFSTM
jgi:hypothetical protein